jgi:predicted AlkP superfamily phosphohydrolase/phosphomutase
MHGGSYAPLRSTLPVMSPPAWTSLITGQNPGKHGIYDFIRFIPGTYQIEATRSDQTRYRTIFDLASQHGRHVIAVNIPLTYPPRPVNGVMVAGPVVPQAQGFAYPPSLDSELREQGYRLDGAITYTPGNDANYLADLKAVARSQLDTTLRLMRTQPWDLAMIVLRAVDEAQTFFWHQIDPHHPQHDPVAESLGGNAILDIHTLIGGMVAELLALVDSEDTVFLVSDHGGGPCYKEVFLNVWLEQQGWLVRKQVHPLNRWRVRWLGRLGLTRENIASRLNGSLLRAVRQRIPKRMARALVPTQVAMLADTIDWSRTRAYSLGNIGQIYINLKGREPQGIVTPGYEREQLLDQITAELYRLCDAGVPVVDNVFRSDDIYHGSYATQGPDLNILMREMSYISVCLREMVGEQIFSPVGTFYSGTHRPLGMIALHGPDAATTGRLPEVAIVDVAPTILWLLDLPIPDDLDGRVLTEFFQPQALLDRPARSMVAAEAPAPISSSPGWTPAEEQAVLDRLRDLGYLE